MPETVATEQMLCLLRPRIMVVAAPAVTVAVLAGTLAAATVGVGTGHQAEASRRATVGWAALALAEATAALGALFFFIEVKT